MRGVYVFNRAVLEHVPQGPASLEKDVFPRLLEQGVYALEQHGMFIDIGTPEDYARAQELCRTLASGRTFQTRNRAHQSPAALSYLIEHELQKRRSSMIRAVFLDRDGVINRKPPRAIT